jgi:peptidoglycan/LPS O-acetylase OafA/YrhL
VTATRSRLPFVDALKAIASQAIVLHHLVLYGPLADRVRPWADGLVGALQDHARLAVQVFLVVAGFLTARALAPTGVPALGAPLALLGRRWRRLAVPYVAAIGLAVVAGAAARALAPLPDTPSVPSPGQLAANLLMLQDVLGFEALSAGLWYVAIDLQLYAAMVALLWLAARIGTRAAGPLLVGAMVLASLLHFNRVPAWDAWAPYFFGAYGLGALAFWAARAPRAATAIAALAAIGTLALLVEPRSRIAVALVTALALAWAERGGAIARWPASTILERLGAISYAVFLVHYPVCLVVGALVERALPASPPAALAGLLLAWAASTAAGALFHRQVEQRFGQAPRRRAPGVGDTPGAPLADPARGASAVRTR